MKVGFIGLGGMGKPVAGNIIDAGFEVTINDLRDAPVNELVQRGATRADNAREVAAASDIVLVSLASNQASEEVALGPDGALAGAKPGDIYIDTSTISPKLIRDIAEKAQRMGVEVLDAPVSGSIAQREEGSLTVMVGGEAETLARARPVLETFGSQIFHVGPIGAGATIKLVNNLTVASNNIAAMEALVLGVKAGLTVDILREVISVSSGASRAFDSMVEQVTTQSAVPQEGNVSRQGLHTLIKDVTLASELARDVSVPLLAGSTTTQAYLAGEARGWAGNEHWALMELFEELAQVRVRPRDL